MIPEGKVALVTGGAMGMGKGFAEALVNAGAKVNFISVFLNSTCVKTFLHKNANTSLDMVKFSNPINASHDTNNASSFYSACMPSMFSNIFKRGQFLLLPVGLHGRQKSSKMASKLEGMLNKRICSYRLRVDTYGTGRQK